MPDSEITKTPAWHQTLGVAPTASLTDAEIAYAELTNTVDKCANPEVFSCLVSAIETARTEAVRNRKARPLTQWLHIPKLPAPRKIIVDSKKYLADKAMKRDALMAMAVFILVSTGLGIAAVLFNL